MGDIRVNLAGLDAFADAMTTETATFQRDEAAARGDVMVGMGSIGTDDAFEEAARVDAAGKAATESATTYAADLGSQFLALAADARNAGLKYRAEDAQAAMDAQAAAFNEAVEGL